MEPTIDSGYARQASSTKAVLDSFSNSLCLAKWFQLTLHLHIGHGQSCHHVSTHKIPASQIGNDPRALHNSKEKLQARKKMLGGQRPSECQYCWNVEDLGRMSDRHFKGSEEWAYPHLLEAVHPTDGKNVNPKYLEVAFDNVCNFKCAYCDLQSSSRWQEEIERLGAYPTQYNNPIWYRLQRRYPLPREKQKPYIEAFWQWWPQLRDDLKVFRITGGEPLMNTNTWRIVDDLIAHPQQTLKFAVNSNLGVKTSLVDRWIEKSQKLVDAVDELTLYTSIDCLGKPAEYIRYGLDANLFFQHVEKCLSDTPKSMKLSYMITVNALSVTGLKDLLAVILSQRQSYPDRFIGFDTPYLRRPAFMSIQVLPESFQIYLQDALNFVREWHQKDNSFRAHEVVKLERMLAWHREAQAHKGFQNRLRREFRNFFREYDRRRSTQLPEVFPDYRDFWNSL